MYSIFERNLQLVAKEAVAKSVRKYQIDLDRIHRDTDGKTITQISGELRSFVSRNGLELAAPEITDWAKTLSQGKRIVLKFEGKVLGR